MNKLHRLLACSLTLIFALSVPSLGWGKLGHMAVAFVAYQKLNQTTRDRIDTLLRINKEYDVWVSEMPTNASDDDKKMMAFMIAATWPDRLRSKKLHPEIDDDGEQSRTPEGSRNTGYDDLLMHKYWHFIDRPFSPDNTPLENPPDLNVQIMNSWTERLVKRRSGASQPRRGCDASPLCARQGGLTWR